MKLEPYTAAVMRDRVARAAFLMPHDLRRSILLRARPNLNQLYETMRAHELGEVEGQGVSLVGFDRLKCIFVHIPKCGGISIGRSLFGSYEGGHMGIPTYQIIFSKAEFDSYFKFSFVRNPWDRLLSGYRFMVNGGDRDPVGTTSLNLPWGEEPGGTLTEQAKRETPRQVQQFGDFESFVTNWVNKENIRVHEIFRPQHRFVCSPNGKLQLDFVGRLESLEADLSIIGDRLGRDLTPVHHNRTFGERSVYKDEYTPATRKIVADLYEKDIRMFNYSFDDG